MTTAALSRPITLSSDASSVLAELVDSDAPLTVDEIVEAVGGVAARPSSAYAERWTVVLLQIAQLRAVGFVRYVGRDKSQLDSRDARYTITPAGLTALRWCREGVPA